MTDFFSSQGIRPQCKSWGQERETMGLVAQHERKRTSTRERKSDEVTDPGKRRSNKNVEL